MVELSFTNQNVLDCKLRVSLREPKQAKKQNFMETLATGDGEAGADGGKSLLSFTSMPISFKANSTIPTDPSSSWSC